MLGIFAAHKLKRRVTRVIGVVGTCCHSNGTCAQGFSDSDAEADMVWHNI